MSHPAINPDDYRLPDMPAGLSAQQQAAFDDDITTRLEDPLTRICNLYTITDADGVECEFVPNEEQCAVLHAIYIEHEQRIAIPKARQIGFSTLIALILFDRAHFSQDCYAAIIDQTEADAQGKLAKVKFAYDRLPPTLRDILTADNKSELGWANGSTITAGLRARGRTPQVVHISEWGPIAYKDPARSTEIKTGVLQAASGKSALVIAESTHMGGKSGDWYELIRRSNETKPEHRTVEDYKVMFFGWYGVPRYTLDGDASQIDEKTRTYFDGDPARGIVGMQERTGHVFTPGQRLFYFKKKQTLGRKIYSEFPTVLDECWLAPHEGAIFGDVMEQARAEGRITVFPWDRSAPMFTSWDLGWNDATSVWFWQVIGRRVAWVKHTKQRHMTAAQMVQWCRSTGLPIALYLMPHDTASKTAATGTSYRDQMVEAGVPQNLIKIVPRSINIWDGINALRDVIGRSEFHATNCEVGISDLEAYHTKDIGVGGTITKEPVHDESSHSCSAARTAAEALVLGMVDTRAALKVAHDVVPLLPNGEMASVVLPHEMSKFRARRPTRARSTYNLL
jgi:hypothetical protein